MLLGYNVFWLPPSLFLLFRFLSLIFGLCCPKIDIWPSSPNTTYSRRKFLRGCFVIVQRIPSLRICIYFFTIFSPFCSPMKSNKNRHNKFVFSISYLCILEAALGHSSMYHFSLNFHLNHISLCSSVVSKSPPDQHHLLSQLPLYSSTY